MLAGALRYRFESALDLSQFTDRMPRLWGGRLALTRPSTGSILLGFIPFTATCFSVSLWDRIYPMVFGLPFNFFWLLLWLFLTPVCMWGAYRCEVPRANGDHGQEGSPR